MCFQKCFSMKPADPRPDVGTFKTAAIKDFTKSDGYKTLLDTAIKDATAKLSAATIAWLKAGKKGDKPDVGTFKTAAIKDFTESDGYKTLLDTAIKDATAKFSAAIIAWTKASKAKLPPPPAGPAPAPVAQPAPVVVAQADPAKTLGELIQDQGVRFPEVIAQSAEQIIADIGNKKNLEQNIPDALVLVENTAKVRDYTKAENNLKVAENAIIALAKLEEKDAQPKLKNVGKAIMDTRVEAEKTLEGKDPQQPLKQ